MKKKKKSPKKSSKQKIEKLSSKQFPTLKLVKESDIAMDFAQKVSEKFDKMIKSVVLFGSTVKESRTSGSDIDIIILLDDSSVKFDQELIAWYREELGKIVATNPYKSELHINTVRLTTWWQDLLRGDPVVMNIIRYGEPLVDFGGFFRPLRMLLEDGKIRPTPEAIYVALERAPKHLAASKQAELGAIEGVYWAMVDSAHALLIAAKITPPNPEQITSLLKEHFVSKKLLRMKYVVWYRDLFELHKKIVHGDLNDIRGQDLDDWQDKAELFIKKMAELISRIIRQ